MQSIRNIIFWLFFFGVSLYLGAVCIQAPSKLPGTGALSVYGVPQITGSGIRAKLYWASSSANQSQQVMCHTARSLCNWVSSNPRQPVTASLVTLPGFNTTWLVGAKSSGIDIVQEHEQIQAYRSYRTRHLLGLAFLCVFPILAYKFNLFYTKN